MPGKCVFNILWLEKEQYKKWLSRDPDKHKARCRLCCKVFDIGNMGESALKAHMAGSKHSSLVEEKTKTVAIKEFFSPMNLPNQTSSTSNAAGVCKPATEASGSLNLFTTGKDVLDAEILWTLKCICNNYSYKSCEDSSQLFARMFPDSLVARQFSCGEKKVAYLCHFGLAPHFQTLLFKSFQDTSHYVLLFDETLNKSTQQKQMDIHIRFWHTDNSVRTRYVTSAFIGHATADDLLKAFYKCTEKLDLSKLIQVSMDGPSVNWKFFKLLQENMRKEFNFECIDVGSCGLHTLNNSFKKGESATEWGISSVLTSLYSLFKDAPARRDDFEKLSTTHKMPVKFCSCRWLENVPSAERALEVWNDVTEYVGKVEKGVLSKVTCKSFGVVAGATQDNLMTVKLNFLLSVAKVLKPFLEKYQSDKPLLPFFAQDVLQLVKKCVQLYKVLKPAHFDRISSVEKLSKFDFSSKSFHASASDVSVGFVGDKLLKEKLFKQQVTEKQVVVLKYECQKFVLTILESLMAKCPVNYSLVRNAACIDPSQMARDSASCSRKMKCVLTYFVQKKAIAAEDCDDILIQFNDFLENVVGPSSSEFLNYDRNEGLDSLLSGYFLRTAYGKVWNVIKMLLILSHGQASVERGFSINKALEVENLKESSYVARRTVHDYITYCGTIHDIPITKELRASASSARMKYMQHLEEERAKKIAASAQEKRKEMFDEIEVLKKRRVLLEKEIDTSETSVNNLSQKAETSRNMNCLSSAMLLGKKSL
ncbi:uncharacterized protein LOC134529009 [Bacillus rossius redtenbacheri]|uniref:uncharacterized protein LOC134529009 n=1 Tax=Bacillus rossius redtenbacheri TaxID=93214 RepID=UPI002FDED0B8